MNAVKFSALTAVFALLAGCDGPGNAGFGTQRLIGPGATLAEAETAFTELETRVLDVKLTEGNTQYTNLPTETVGYRGIISGGPGADGTGDFTHYADLSLSTDFNDVTGSVTNFTTDVVGFENPTGTIDITGTVSDGAPVAVINFSGSGALIGTGVEADYTMSTTSGNFLGSDGSALEGSQESDFDWTFGRVGTDISDGDWYAER
ncbi:hypothetical protein [Silicimonas sp. MF1-12-2]|uniref:hypothetical protein n=1 Tax=Silicimonas sp. MF1-12-2 TaxID=3384793 RepID=UPI0039B5AEB6